MTKTHWIILILIIVISAGLYFYGKYKKTIVTTKIVTGINPENKEYFNTGIRGGAILN